VEAAGRRRLGHAAHPERPPPRHRPGHRRKRFRADHGVL